MALFAFGAIEKFQNDFAKCYFFEFNCNVILLQDYLTELVLNGHFYCHWKTFSTASFLSGRTELEAQILRHLFMNAPFYWSHLNYLKSDIYTTFVIHNCSFYIENALADGPLSLHSGIEKDLFHDVVGSNSGSCLSVFLLSCISGVSSIRSLKEVQFYNCGTKAIKWRGHIA